MLKGKYQPLYEVGLDRKQFRLVTQALNRKLKTEEDIEEASLLGKELLEELGKKLAEHLKVIERALDRVDENEEVACVPPPSKQLSGH